MKKICVVGGGLAGSSCAYFASLAGCDVTLFYSKDVHAASSVASGLLHPYVGCISSVDSYVFKALSISLDLLKKVDEHIDCLTPVTVVKEGNTPRKAKAIRSLIEKYPDVKRVERFGSFDSCEFPGFSVDVLKYLKGLQYLLDTKITVEPCHIECESDLSQFDGIIYAMGHAAPSFHSSYFEGCKQKKGERIRIHSESSPGSAIIGNGYIVPVGKCHSVVGSTYEENFSSTAPSKLGYETLLKKAAAFSSKFTVIDISSGVRLIPSGNECVVAKHSQREVICAGLGSKGLLFHAIKAKEAVDLLLRNIME